MITFQSVTHYASLDRNITGLFKGLSPIHCLDVVPDDIQLTILAATKQLYECFILSVCPSVTPFSICSHHRIIMQFSGGITNDRCEVHAQGQGQRLRVEVTEVKAKAVTRP